MTEDRMRLVNRRRRIKRRTTRTYAHTLARTNVHSVSRGRSLSAVKLLPLALLAVIVGLVVLFSTSPAFFVYSDETEYIGLRLLAPEEVWKATGIPDGLSVFFLNTSRAARQLKDLPEVKDARVSLQLPNQLRIAITERETKAVWVQGGTRWWVDETGKVLTPAEDTGELAVMPAVYSTVTAPIGAGQQVDTATVRSALQYHMLMPEAATFSYAPEMGLSLVTPEGIYIHLGDDSECGKKVAVLRVVMGYLAERNIKHRYIDVRVPEAPVYK